MWCICELSLSLCKWCMHLVFLQIASSVMSSITLGKCHFLLAYLAVSVTLYILFIARKRSETVDVQINVSNCNSRVHSFAQLTVWCWSYSLSVSGLAVMMSPCVICTKVSHLFWMFSRYLCSLGFLSFLSCHHVFRSLLVHFVLSSRAVLFSKSL